MPSLKKSAAWDWFALYIKERDDWTCFTCGKKARGGEMGAGHFIQAFGHQNTFFNERNVHAQCSSCNCWGGTTILEYRRRIIKKYGEGADVELEKLGRIQKQHTPKELKEISRIYREKYRALLERAA